MKIGAGKRTTGLVVSVVLAALASLALVSYMRGVESRAFAGAETVEVYVAREAIPAGTSGGSAWSRGLIGTTSLPRKAVAEGAIASVGQIEGLVADVEILRGEQILQSRFVEPGGAGSHLIIPAGRQAMSVEVEAPPGVAGFVQAGSRVSVIAHVDVTDGGGRAIEPRSQYVVQNVEVLAVGTRVVETADAGARAKAAERQQVSDKVLLTLAVTAAEAEKLSFAINEGEVYVTLLPDGAKPVKTAGRTRRNEFR